MGRAAMTAVLMLAIGATAARAQSLEDFDYENLAFRGIGLEIGYIWPNKVESTPTAGLRMDLGYLGPGLRVTPSITYWSSRMKASEVRSLEDRLAALVASQQPPGSPAPVVELGPIDWSDIALALDGHVVWRTAYDVLTFAGAGAAVHFMNGDGEAIANTFIEDLLDTIGAGFDVHAGAEYPLADNMRVYAMGRLELLQDIWYAGIRGGVQIQLGPDAEGER